jgi:hypothetical protein
METPSEPTPADDRLSDIEIQREKQLFADLTAKLDKGFGGMHQRYRIAFSVLMDTGAFSEKDLHLMMRGQVLSPEFSSHPCESYHDKDELEDLFNVERRRYSQERFSASPLAPVPVGRHRLHCPLYERGRKGDPLVPCFAAQQANPKCPDGRMEKAPFLPEDLPREQKQAIDFFCDSRADLPPCRVVQSVIQYDLGWRITKCAPELLQIGKRPVPPMPTPPREARENLGLRRILETRQAALETAARMDAEAELHRRQLLFHLVETGRLSNHDLIEMIYSAIMVTDEGWLPCRDDPQRTHISAVKVENDETDDADQDVVPQRQVCGLIVRAMEGDTTVPCCEAQKVAASPQRMAQIEARDERHQRESDEWWRKRGGRPDREPDANAAPEPVYFAGEDDAPAGPQDIVRLLQIRPCYLLGHTAATFLYGYGQFLAAHPERFHFDKDPE